MLCSSAAQITQNRDGCAPSYPLFTRSELTGSGRRGAEQHIRDSAARQDSQELSSQELLNCAHLRTSDCAQGNESVQQHCSCYARHHSQTGAACSLRHTVRLTRADIVSQLVSLGGECVQRIGHSIDDRSKSALTPRRTPSCAGTLAMLAVQIREDFKP